MAAPAPVGIPTSYVPLQLPRSYRRVERVEGSIAYAAGVSNPLKIDQAGLCLGLLLTFQGNLQTGATAPILTSDAPYSLIDYVTIQTSGGVGRAINIPGYMLNVVERTREADYSDGPTFPVAANQGAPGQAWSFSLHVPLCVRDGDLYGGWSDYVGAIYTGDPDVTMQVQVTFHDLTGVFTNQGAAAATLNNGVLTVTSIKLDVPEPSADDGLLAAISWTHQLIQETQIQNLAAGPLNVNPPTAEPRVYLRLWEFIKNNGAYANGVLSTLDATLQDYVDFHQSIPEYVILERQRRRYIEPLPAGTYVMDFSPGNTRNQWLSVERVTLFKLINNLVAPITNPSSLTLVSESLTPSPLARKWLNLRAQRGGEGKLRAA